LAKIIFNQQIDEYIYHLKIAGKFQGSMGQFYMLRGWDSYHPVLSRPFSIFDIDAQSISFIYKTVGEGTKLLSQLKKEGTIHIFGPYGRGFPQVGGKIALIGGGMGVAPLFLAAKELRTNPLIDAIDIYLGFKETAVLTNLFEKVAYELVIDIGGFISHRVSIHQYQTVFTCGPEDMMKAIVDQKKSGNPDIYVSLERRMGCGLGACLSCTCRTRTGNRLTCKDGPIFHGEDVFFET
jgi:dihydroorotate dehydrogenase electron transfer subunit